MWESVVGKYPRPLIPRYAKCNGCDDSSTKFCALSANTSVTLASSLTLILTVLLFVSGLGGE